MKNLLPDVGFVERSAFVAAPLAGKTLVQMGATVIKIDDLRGGPDWTRWPVSPDGTSLYWAELNRGKKSVLLDMRSGEGRELAAALITAVGGYLTNLDGRPPLTSSKLFERRADLIYMLIEGNRGGRTAIDYTVNAAVGHASIVGPPDHVGPINYQLPVWDISTGLLAAATVASAAGRRASSGLGAMIRTSLLDVAMSLTGSLGWLAEAQMSSRPRPRIGNAIYGAFGHDFVTRDEARVMVAAVTDRQWRALVEATQSDRVLSLIAEQYDLDLSIDGDRYRASSAIAGVLSSWFGSRTLNEAASALDRCGACWDVYRELPEFINEDPRASLDNSILALDPDVDEPRKVARFPLTLDDEPQAPVGRVPRRGEHTEDVLATALGLSDAEVGRLHDRRVIAFAPTEQRGVEYRPVQIP